MKSGNLTTTLSIKMFPVDMQIHHVMALLQHHVCSQQLRLHQASNCTLMLACSTALGEFDIPGRDADNSIPLSQHGSAQGRLAQSQSVGQLPLECPGCQEPQCARHLWHKQRMAPRCVCAPMPAAALRTVPGRLPSKRLMSQLLSCVSKYTLSEHHLQCLPMPLKQPLFLIVCTATLCACFHIHSCNCKHMGVLSLSNVYYIKLSKTFLVNEKKAQKKIIILCSHDDKDM